MSKNRKRRFLIRKSKRLLIINVFLLFILFLGIGYSLLSTNLSVDGTVSLSKYDLTLYGVLEKAAKKGIYAKEYTGNHNDSMNTSLSTEKIYHWYADNDTEGTEIQNMNNVIFANHCWQMIRTTDTGGVKMIYNGEVEDGKCLNTRGSHVGYLSRTTQTLGTSTYYGTSYIYDKTNNVFKLDGTITTGSINLGEYTCRNTSANATCATLYLVDSLSSGSSYYVIPLKGNSHYSQFGTLQFNRLYESPADVGYMYNSRYVRSVKNNDTNESMLWSTSLGTTYWYADSITWNSTTSKYELNNPYQVSSESDYLNLVGKYTFRNTSQTYSSNTVRYIAAVNNTTMYYFELGTETGSTHDLSYYNHTYTYGNSYTDNGNGTYTINSPTTVHKSDWYSNYSNVGGGKYVCKNVTDNTCSELWYTTKTSTTYITYLKVANVYKYAKGFTYNNGSYTLNSDSVSFWDINNSTNTTSLNNHHYTCWNTTGVCTTISYVYYLTGADLYYINLSGGKNVNDALNEMLYNNVNTTNSTIKTGVDAWYKNNLLEEYDDYIEDTIYCNDRSILALNGWDPDGGNIKGNIQFKENNPTSNLSCTNTTDKFSTTNASARLTYKVGLMSNPEVNLLNNGNVRKTGQWYWLVTPNYFSQSEALVRIINTSGSLGNNTNAVYNSGGVRPAISLKPGIEYASGTGTMADPYVVSEQPQQGPVSFAKDSWATIINAVRTNNTSVYNVGDTKTINMGSLGIHRVRIANKSTPAACSTTGFSQTACGFVLEFVDVISNHNMNPGGEYNGVTYTYGWNVDGWPATSMRAYVNSDIYNALPTDLKDGIINTTVISGHGNTAGETNFTSTDKIYLLSTHEVWKNEEDGYLDRYDTAYNNTRQLDYYSNLGVTTSNYAAANKQNAETDFSWWLRSADSYTNTAFYMVSFLGHPNSGHSANGTYGVSPAFRIG